MKKVLSKTIIIISAVLVVALAATVLVLCLVDRKPMDAVNGYDRVEIYNFNTADRYEVDAAAQPEAKVAIDKALDDTDFSIMQGILEGKPNATMKFTDAEYDSKALTDLKSTDTQYMLKFIFTSPKTITVEDTTVTYDRAVVFVSDTEYEIGKMEVVFYLDSHIDNEATGNEDLSSEFYTVSPVTFNCRPTALFDAVTDVLNA